MSLIAAYATGNRAIGLEGGIPWRLPADLTRFKRLTMGHHLIMGRRTHGSLAGRELPGRRLIVLSRRLDYVTPGNVAVVASLTEALGMAANADDDEAFIGGGAALYAHALARDAVNRMYLTEVHASVRGDTFFPEFDLLRWREAAAEYRPSDERNPYALTFRTFERVRAD